MSSKENKSYRKGANRERKIKKMLEDRGHEVFRVAGSKGLIDLVVLDQRGNVYLVQVVSVSAGRKRIETYKKKLCEKYAGKMFYVMLVIYFSEKKIETYTLFADGRWERTPWITKIEGDGKN